MFIVLYGINNIGKSTQILALADKFRAAGKTVKVLKYPVYDLEPTGPRINALLRNPNTEKISGEEFQMLYIRNRLDYEPQVLSDLERYIVVLAEDYIGTGMAWGMTQGLAFKKIEELNQKYPQKKPDLEILLDGNRFLSGKEASHRNEQDDRAVEETRKNFLFLAKKFHWPIVSANQQKEEITKKLWDTIVTFSYC